MDVAKFVKLISRPPLKLLLCQPAAQQKLAHWMTARMALLQCMLQIGNQFLRSEQSSHGPSYDGTPYTFFSRPDHSQVDRASPVHFQFVFSAWL
jgi:hypothetical protein